MTKTELLNLLDSYDDDDVIGIWEWNPEAGQSHTWNVEPTLQVFRPDDMSNVIKDGPDAGKRCIRLMKSYYVPKID